MCGLVCAIGSLTSADEKVFAQLLIVDSLRGTDSTGVASVISDGSHSICKAVGNPYELLESRAFTRTMLGAQRVLMGHNRYATQGAVNKRNSHPFEFDSLIGMHNGTIRNKYSLEDAKDFVVDSENVYHHIEKKGLRDAVNTIDGAYALIWWDKEEEMLNVLRNVERPLCAVEDDKGNFWFCSEGWMLEGVLSRNGIKHKEVINVAQDKHYQIPVNLKTGAIGKLIETPMVKVPKFQQVASTYFPKPAVQPAVKPVVQNPIAVPEVARTKKFLLTIVALDTDSHGSNYFQCEAEDWLNADIRLYYNQLEDNPSDYVGREFNAELMSTPVLSMTGRFYKVYASSVEYIDPVTEGEAAPWETCGWCTAAFQQSEKHGRCSDGSLICASCASDTDIQQYIKYSVVNP